MHAESYIKNISSAPANIVDQFLKTYVLKQTPKRITSEKFKQKISKNTTDHLTAFLLYGNPQL
jgi:hypothetical protein